MNKVLNSLGFSWLDLPSNYSDMTREELLSWSELKHFYRQQLAYAKPNLNESVAVCLGQLEQGSMIVAALRIRHYQQAQLLTGLVTHSQYRQQGIASQLLEFAVPKLASAPSYIFTQANLQAYYQRHNFQTIALDDALLAADIKQQFLRLKQNDEHLIMRYQIP